MLERLLMWLPRIAVARPREVSIAVAATVLIAGVGLIHVDLRTDGRALVPRDDPTVHFDAALRREFHLRDPIVVYVESDHPDGIYNTGTLRRVRDLSDALAALPEVAAEDVVSLATERRQRVFPGTLDFRRFLEPLPDTSEWMDRLREDIAAADIVSGTLVSHDGRGAAILVGVPPALPGAGATDRGSLYRRIRDVAQRHEGGADRIVVVGAPVAEALLGEHILLDVALLTPASMGVIALVILAGCGRAAAVALALVEVGACLVFTFGVMGWQGTPVYLTTGVLPVVLTAMGLADEIHIFRQYQRVLGEPARGPHPAAVLATMERMARPVVLTSLTTAVGLLSFATSSIDAVRAFGVYAAVGVLFCMLFSLTAIPAALARLDPARMRHPLAPAAGGAAMPEPGSRPPAWGRTARALAPLVRRPTPTLRALAVVTAAIGLGACGVRVQDGWIEGFAPDSEFRRAVDHVNAKLFGVHQLVAHLAFDPAAGDGRPLPRAGEREGPLLDPELWRAIGDFESFLRGQEGVGGVLGAYGQLTSTAFLFGGLREEARGVPATPRLVARVLDSFDLARGVRRRREVIHDDLRRATVTVFFEDANYRQTAAVMDAARDYADEHLRELGATLRFAGDVAVSQAMIPAVVATQLRSLAFALVGVALVVLAVYRSPRLALLAVVPSAAAATWIFGAMGWLGIPLGVATSMFCAITLGIGVDYAIHFLERVRRARQAGRPEPALVAIDEAGPAILLDTVAIAAGFGLLTASRVPASAHLGLFVALALGAACLLTLVGLAAFVERDDVGAPRPTRGSEGIDIQW